MQTKASYLLLPFLFLTHLPFAKADLITDLGTGYAYGINASGEVVGTTSTPLQAFLYSGGTTTYFGDNGGSEAFAVNASGQITGYSGSDAFIYSGGTLIVRIAHHGRKGSRKRD